MGIANCSTYASVASWGGFSWETPHSFPARRAGCNITQFIIPFVRAHELWPIIFSVISTILEFIGFALCIQGPNDNCRL